MEFENLKPSDSLLMQIIKALSDNKIMNYTATHRAFKKKHSLTFDIKESWYYDQSNGIEEIRAIAEKMDYQMFEEEPPKREVRRFTFLFKSSMNVRPPHSGETPEWVPYKEFKLKE